MADKTDTQRLVDLKAALKSAKARGGFLSLQECAALWGVTKPRFVNKRAEIAKFPEATKTEGNAHFYPEKAALRSMIAHLEGHKRVNMRKAASRAAMIGGSAQGRSDMESSLSMHTPAELATLNRIAADIAQREQDQGHLIAAADVAAIAGQVFSRFSDFLSNLSNDIDPHGALPSKVRGLIDSRCHDQLLSLHSEMKGMLVEDAHNGRTRKTAKGARGKPAPGQRRGSVRKSA